tara:strand:+ start:1822 stop:2052 length:231 start_codon:yes stop_codon:yes gene_type:complete
MAGIGLALRGAGKVLSKLKKKKKLSLKEKRIKKENKKVAGLAAAGLTGTAGYVGAMYKKNLQDYPETGKNLKKKNK